MPRRPGDPNPRNGRPYRRQTAAFRADPTNWVCTRCGHDIDMTLPARHPMSWTRGHKIEIAAGGSLTSADNFAPEHLSCNASAGAHFGNRTRREQRTRRSHSRDWYAGQ